MHVPGGGAGAGPAAGGTGFDEYGPRVPGAQHSAASAAAGLDGVLYGASHGLLRSGLGAYGERVFGSGRNFVQTNVSRYITGNDAQYYFQVNDQYVRNKLKVIACPLVHKGHWTRIAEQVAGGLTYKPPKFDINAPDLYIPLMAIGTYMVLGGFAVGFYKPAIAATRFSPHVLSSRLTQGLIGWAAETALLRFSLYSLGSGDAPLLDLIAYSGYLFVGVCISIFAWTVWHPAYYPVTIYLSLCMGIFLVKTMKRVLFAEVRNYDQDSSRHHYLLLFIALAQFPLALWLGRL